MMEADRSRTAEAFKALGDPVRWTIVRYLAEQPELPGARLNEFLSISRPTISYHIRILVQAGLVDVRKRGRTHFYSLREDTMRSLSDAFGTLMTTMPVSDKTVATASTPSLASTLADQLTPTVVPTW